MGNYKFVTRQQLSSDDEDRLREEWGIVFVERVQDVIRYETSQDISSNGEAFLQRRFGLLSGVFVAEQEIPADVEEILFRKFGVFSTERECLVRTVVDNLPDALWKDPHKPTTLQSAERFQMSIPQIFESMLSTDREASERGDDSVMFYARHEIINLGSGTIADIMTYLLTDMHIKKMEKLALASQAGGENEN